MQFAAGADYHVWNNIYVGADIRYQLTFGNLDGTNTEGFTTGGYLTTVNNIDMLLIYVLHQ
jgi:opacity protein-like surface antigen